MHLRKAKTAPAGQPNGADAKRMKTIYYSASNEGAATVALALRDAFRQRAGF